LKCFVSVVSVLLQSRGVVEICVFVFVYYLFLVIVVDSCLDV